MLELKVPRKIDLTGLKAFAKKELPLDSTLREMILGGRDQIEVKEFITKMEIWMRLFNIEMKLKEINFSRISGNGNKRRKKQGAL